MLIDNNTQRKKQQSIPAVVMKHVQRGVLVRKSVWEGTQVPHSSGYRAPSQKKISAAIEKTDNLATYCVVRLGLHGFRYQFMCGCWFLQFLVINGGRDNGLEFFINPCCL